jgi:hypothetical protein
MGKKMRNSVEELKSKMAQIISGPKKQKMKFILAFQVEYEVDPETYTDPDPIKMGEEDTASALEAPLTVLKGMAELPGATVRVKCEAIQTAGEKAGLVVGVKA